MILIRIVFADEKIRDDQKSVASDWLSDHLRGAKWICIPKSWLMQGIGNFYLQPRVQDITVSADLGKVDNRFCIVRTKNLQYFVWSPFFIELCHILEEFEDHGLQYELNKMFLKSVLDNNFISTGTDTSNFLPFIPCSYIRFSYLGIPFIRSMYVGLYLSKQTSFDA